MLLLGLKHVDSRLTSAGLFEWIWYFIRRDNHLQRSLTRSCSFLDPEFTGNRQELFVIHFVDERMNQSGVA